MTRGVFTPTQLTATELNDCFDPPRCRLGNSANISLANAINTSITFDTEVFDDGGMHSVVSNTSRITVPTGGGGLYIIGAAAEFAQNATGIRDIFIVLNGTTTIGFQRSTSPSASAATRLSTTTAYVLNDGDYVELRCNQTSGGNLNIVSAGDSSPVLWCCWMAVQ